MTTEDSAKEFARAGLIGDAGVGLGQTHGARIRPTGRLSYESRYADLLFEVVTHRYEAKRPIVLTII